MQLRRLSLVFASFVTAVSLAAACGGDDGRKGGQGASCTKTDDCESPLQCLDMVCTSGAGGSGSGTETGTPSGTQSGSATGTETGTPSGTGGSGGVGPGESLGECDDCLDMQCASQLAACGSACIGVEACIEIVCRSVNDAQEESDCFVYCQDSNPGGKDAHLAVVNCAFDGAGATSCGFPNGSCVLFPADYDLCRETMTAGSCADELAACDASSDCTAYRDCTAACGTASNCINCSATSSGQAGRQLLEGYERCVAAECVSESWLQ